MSDKKSFAVPRENKMVCKNGCGKKLTYKTRVPKEDIQLMCVHCSIYLVPE